MFRLLQISGVYARRCAFHLPLTRERSLIFTIIIPTGKIRNNLLWPKGKRTRQQQLTPNNMYTCRLSFVHPAYLIDGCTVLSNRTIVGSRLFRKFTLNSQNTALDIRHAGDGILLQHPIACRRTKWLMVVEVYLSKCVRGKRLNPHLSMYILNIFNRVEYNGHRERAAFIVASIKVNGMDSLSRNDQVVSSMLSTSLSVVTFPLSWTQTWKYRKRINTARHPRIQKWRCHLCMTIFGTEVRLGWHHCM